MLFSHDDNCVAVECGDTSTTLVVDVRNGFAIAVCGEEYTDDWDDVPVSFTSRNLSGYVPGWFLKFLQEAWFDHGGNHGDKHGFDSVETYVYRLAHSIADYDFQSWSDWMNQYSADEAPALV